MVEKVLYTAQGRATGGGRDGKAATLDGGLSVTLAPPRELGGSGQGNNPEQLFAVGYAACYLGALRFAASQDKSLPAVPDDATVTVSVGIGPRADGGFGLNLSMEVSLPGVERRTAEKMVALAHGVCPYSNALKAGLPVETTISETAEV